MKFKIKDRLIGESEPTYFIADIAANHDGNLSRAKKLIRLAKESGADAAKFQHFKANKIVSDFGFKTLKSQASHQKNWKKSVFEVYQDAEINRTWDLELKSECDKVGIHFFSSPYDFEAIDELEDLMPAYKIGSGDLNWDEIIIRMAKKSKPIILATGASDIDEVIHAVSVIEKHNKKIVLMQCNTNYTANIENYHYIALNVLKTYQLLFPNAILGLSDHTFGHSTVLGAVALGARVVEKHFTDDNDRVGPDHRFAMNPKTWKEMVENTRQLEAAIGNTIKKVEDNEQETVVLQRRCLRAARDFIKGEKILKKDIEILRPAPKGSLCPNDLDIIVGRKIAVDLAKGDHFTMSMID